MRDLPELGGVLVCTDATTSRSELLLALGTNELFLQSREEAIISTLFHHIVRIRFQGVPPPNTLLSPRRGSVSPFALVTETRLNHNSVLPDYNLWTHSNILSS